MAVKRICSAAAAIRINTTVAMADSAIAASPPFLFNSDKQENKERDAAAEIFIASMKILEKTGFYGLMQKILKSVSKQFFHNLISSVRNNRAT